MVLLDGRSARSAAAVLEEEPAVRALIPPIGGLAFFTARGEAAAELDRWWHGAAVGDHPVVLTAHDDELALWIPGLDADFVVALPQPEAVAAYAGLANVRTAVEDDPVRLARFALQSQEPALLPDPFDLLAATETVPLPNPEAPTPAVPTSAEPPLSRHSILGSPAARPRSPSPRAGLDLRGLLERLGRRQHGVDPELGQAVLKVKPLVAAVVSRKGGVGKTASAAAVAAILGEALDPFGHTAALIDANIGNPDAWGRLDVERGAATVRELIGYLSRGEDPPSPAWSKTPALAVYPESREAGDGYTPAEIQRLAAYMKLRHAAVIVDLPNRLPAFSSAEAAVAAAWIAEADVVVVPTTADPTALLGVIEYQAAESVRDRPVVVPYIVPRLREIRDAPEVRELLERIEMAGAIIARVPDDDRATLGLIRHVAITEVGGELRRAYVTLARRVTECARRG